MLYVPGSQAAGMVLPPAQKVPAGHGRGSEVPLKQ
jgi:hypothetical protein